MAAQVATTFLDMTHVSSIVCALVQGASEALPISSSLHIQIVSRWLGLGLGSDTKLMAAFLHAGSVVGIVLFFAKDIMGVWSSVWRWNDNRYRSWRVLLGHLVTGNLGLAAAICAVYVIGPGMLKSSPSLSQLAWISLTSAVVLQVAHWYQRVTRAQQVKRGTPPSFQAPGDKDLWPQAMPWWHAFLIGASQCPAMLWSGVSRLGATLTMACLLGQALPQAVRFSFLLGLPATSASVLYGWWSCGAFAPTTGASVLMGLAVGCVVCFSTWITLALMRHLAQRDWLWPIILYRVLLALIVVMCV